MTGALALLAPASPQHAAWRAAAEEARVAYWAWCDAVRHRAADAYAVYVAATDREAAAADACRRAVTTVPTAEVVLTAGLPET